MVYIKVRFKLVGARIEKKPVKETTNCLVTLPDIQQERFWLGISAGGFWAGGRGEADDDSRENGFDFSIFSMLCCNAMLAWGDRAPDLEFWSWRPPGRR